MDDIQELFESIDNNMKKHEEHLDKLDNQYVEGMQAYDAMKFDYEMLKALIKARKI